MTSNPRRTAPGTQHRPVQRRTPTQLALAVVVAVVRRLVGAVGRGLRLVARAAAGRLVGWLGPRLAPFTRRLPTGAFERRSLAMVLVFAMVAAATVVKLVNVQVLDAADYAARAADQAERFNTLPADRGRIYDRSGEVLALSVASASVYGVPSSFVSSTAPDGTVVPPAEGLGEAVRGLAPLLGVPEAELRQKLTSGGSFVWLARQLDASVGAAVEELGLNGIVVRNEPRRVYPGGPLAGQVLGITDIDGVGVAGMEDRFDAVLAGQPGWVTFESINRDGGVIPSAERELQASVPGTDVVLTLDRQLQFTAERVANEVIEQYQAVGASVVVLEVGTGDVLAMASAPTVDLADRDSLETSTLRNRAVTDMFEPGSVQKAITAAAAIEAGVVTPDTVFMVPDSIEVGGKRFTDAHSHPDEEMTFTEIIETSSNVGTIMVAQELGDERLAEWLTRFGYGKPLEIGFPGEAAGLVRPVEEWWGTSLPTIAIGQGVAVTLLQEAHAYATIANDGIAVQPRLVRGTVGRDGVLQPVPATSGRPVLSASTAAQVRAMLAAVVSGERGTGASAQVAGFTVAGKTGTARKPREDGRGYSGKYVANFVGMAPADDPRIVVAVMVDEPTTIWGGVVAAPAFSEVMSEALRRSNVQSTTTGPALATSLRAARRDAERVAREQAAAELARQQAAAEAAEAAQSVAAADQAGADAAPAG